MLCSEELIFFPTVRVSTHQRNCKAQYNWNFLETSPILSRTLFDLLACIHGGNWLVAHVISGGCFWLTMWWQVCTFVHLIYVTSANIGPAIMQIMKEMWKQRKLGNDCAGIFSCLGCELLGLLRISLVSMAHSSNTCWSLCGRIFWKFYCTAISHLLLYLLTHIFPLFFDIFYSVVWISLNLISASYCNSHSKYSLTQNIHMLM
jgi:hypothetical protein